MNPSQKRCLVTSAIAHSSLLLIVIFGAAFFKPEQNSQPTSKLLLIPANIVEGVLPGGGGNPNIIEKDEQIKGDTIIPQPEEVKPPPPIERKPEIVEKPKEKPPVEKPPVEKPPVEKAKPIDKAPKTTPEKVNIKELLKPISAETKSKAAADARNRDQVAAKDAAADKFAKDIRDAAARLKAGFPGGTAVEVYGPGGPAYADYASFVRAIYDSNWLVADDVTDDNSTAKVRVTIARDGDVIDARIIQRSGNAALDRSVELTLRRVKFIRAFPASMKDSSRTYTINFNLRSKRATG